MQFKQWFIKEDVFPQNNTATVFHRTHNITNISRMASTGYQPSRSLMGAGLYTTFKIESQFSDKNINSYGPYIVKFKLSNINKYLIFEKQVAQQFFGNNYKISDQIKELGLEDKLKNPEKYDQLMETTSDSSETLYALYAENSWISNPNSGIIGVIYHKDNDGYCLLKYPPIEDNTISMLSYAYENGKDLELQKKLVNNIRNDSGSRELIGWIKTMPNGTAIKSTYANTKNVEQLMDELAKAENPLALKFNQNLFDNLDDIKLKSLMKRANNKDEITKIIIQYKKELTNNNVYTLLDYAKNKDEIIRLIIESKKVELNSSVIRVIISDAINKDEILKLIIPYMKDLSFLGNPFDDETVSKDEIAKLIIQNKKELTQSDINNLLRYTTNKDEIRSLIASKITPTPIKTPIQTPTPIKTPIQTPTQTPSVFKKVWQYFKPTPKPKIVRPRL